MLLRFWEEVSHAFLDYIRKSDSSPFKRMKDIFTKREYQKLMGNLSHSHMIIEVDFANLTTDGKDFVDNLALSSMY